MIQKKIYLTFPLITVCTVSRFLRLNFYNCAFLPPFETRFPQFQPLEKVLDLKNDCILTCHV